jgi:transposase
LFLYEYPDGYWTGYLFLINLSFHSKYAGSQQCLNCRHLTKTSNEIYVCKYCHEKIDRDVLGSVNILLKNW